MIVALAVSVQLLLEEFAEAEQVKFRHAVALSAGVQLGKVRIAKIQVMTGRRNRRLLGSNLRIDVEIEASSRSSAGVVSQILTEENLSGQLQR